MAPVSRSIPQASALEVGPPLNDGRWRDRGGSAVADAPSAPASSASPARRVQALQTVYAERIPHELEQLLLAGASLDAEEYSYRWAVYSATLDECILVYASLVEEARELQRSARRAG